MFFMARAADPTLPGLLGRSRMKAVRAKGSSGMDMDPKISRCVEVAVPLPIRSTLTYRLPGHLAGSADPGSRALVPVGTRVVTGLGMGEGACAEGGGRGECADGNGLPDAEPLMGHRRLPLSQWAFR